mmetsp:Transcript_6742/g.16284  ORF Transcript_6742/g.16284 Transcript_6742/m.16284 type:complete len:226 (-) Transcript_6742:1726-2403(-)
MVTRVSTSSHSSARRFRCSRQSRLLECHSARYRCAASSCGACATTEGSRPSTGARRMYSRCADCRAHSAVERFGCDAPRRCRHAWDRTSMIPASAKRDLSFTMCSTCAPNPPWTSKASERLAGESVSFTTDAASSTSCTSCESAPTRLASAPSETSRSRRSSPTKTSSTWAERSKKMRHETSQGRSAFSPSQCDTVRSIASERREPPRKREGIARRLHAARTRSA